jgi:hypothetical protein
MFVPYHKMCFYTDVLFRFLRDKYWEERTQLAENIVIKYCVCQKHTAFLQICLPSEISIHFSVLGILR